MQQPSQTLKKKTIFNVSSKASVLFIRDHQDLESIVENIQKIAKQHFSIQIFFACRMIKNTRNISFHLAPLLDNPEEQNLS